jgi:uncharacterized membrane protein YhaH (DUF805 family)
MDLQAVFDNFVRIVRDHYFDLHGRVGRAEFWYFVLAYVVLELLASILGGITGLPLALLYNLGLLLPAAGMGARRLQDSGRDGRLVWIPVIGGFAVQVYSAMAAVGFWLMGWFSWVLFGPLLGIIGLAVAISWVVLIYFWIQPGEPGDNRYGPPPPIFAPSQRASSAP